MEWTGQVYADSPVVTAEIGIDAPPERVWDLWADPRKLERWWGPPFWPATFTAHDLAPGSHVEYHMTGPTGIPRRRVVAGMHATPA